MPRPALLVAFAFTVMADPVSSVTYAIEAALRALDGRLDLLVGTMALVLVTIAIVAASYHQLIGRFPGGGGGAEALAAAFGEGWAFLPAGALLVDFTLTITVSSAAAASAVIAAAPELADARVPIALALTAVVAVGSCLGHRGREAFAAATLAFVAIALVVAGSGAGAEPAGGAGSPLDGGEGLALGAMLLAMPLGMALATGVEAPSNAIAQLPELSDRGRRLAGRLTVWIMLAIVATLTLAFAGLASALDVGEPPADSTLLAEVARASVGDGALFETFQAASALLLLAAAASSYLAGSGLLKALALHGGDHGSGLVPRPFRATNRFRVPYWGVLLLLGTSGALIVAAGGRDQEIVHYYAVAVFASFLGAIAGAARLSYREGRRAALAVNLAGIALTGFVLVLNLARLDAAIPLAVAAIVSGGLYRQWVARGRPAGVGRVTREA